MAGVFSKGTRVHSRVHEMLISFALKSIVCAKGTRTRQRKPDNMAKQWHRCFQDVSLTFFNMEKGDPLERGMRHGPALLKIPDSEIT